MKREKNVEYSWEEDDPILRAYLGKQINLDGLFKVWMEPPVESMGFN
jgi:hypothetical protein